MKVYALAFKHGEFTFPLERPVKVYRTKTRAIKALEKYITEHPGAKNVKILCADNWHEEE